MRQWRTKVDNSLPKLRIYEGTSEIQRLVIAEQVLKTMREQPEPS